MMDREKLDRIEELLPDFLKNSSEFYLIVIDMEGKYAYTNQRFVHKFNKLSDDFIGLPSEITIHPDDLEKCNTAAWQCIKNPGAVVNLDVRKPLNKRKNQYYWSNWDFSLLTDPDSGETLGVLSVGKDITNEYNSVNELESLQKRTEVIFENINEGFYELNSQWEFIKINQVAEKLLAKSSEELIDKVIWEVFPENQRYDYPKKFMKSYYLNERSTFREFREDLNKWLSYRLFPKSDGLSVFIDDISDFVRSENSLNEQKSVLEIIFDQSLAGYWERDFNTSTYFLSEGIYKVLGYELQDLNLEGNWLQNLVHPDDISILESNLADHIRSMGDVIYENEIRILKKSGEYVWIYNTGRVIKWNTDATPARMVGCHIDIHSRKIYEAERMEKRMQLELQSMILANIGQSVIVTNPMAQIVYWNKAAERIYGWTVEEAVGKNIIDITPTTMSQEEAKDIFKTLSAGKNWEGEFRVKNKLGNEFPVYVTNTPFFDDLGKLAGIIGISSDITNRKKRDAEIRELNENLEKLVEKRTEQLEATLEELKLANERVVESLNKEIELNKLKSQFISMISHEYKGPITAILNYAYIIETVTENMSIPRMNKYVDNIRIAAEKMNHLLEEVLIIGRSDLGKVKIKIQDIDFCQFVKEQVENALIVDQNNHNINLHCLKDKLIIKSDTLQLEHIFSNLLSNACKYSPNNTEIDILFGELDEQNIKIEVIDYGLGIPEESLPHLFENFHRAENVANIKGTGLGLPIVKKAVQYLGGSIQVESKEGKGSKFTITLPQETIVSAS